MFLVVFSQSAIFGDSAGFQRLAIETSVFAVRSKFDERRSHAVLLIGTELAKREAQWLQRHDQATNGIMGFFPASLNEPV